MKLTGGDLKAVQVDSGHSGLKMIEDVYSHILDEDRVKTAQIMEEVYYSARKPSENRYEAENGKEETVPVNPIDLNDLLQILSHPEMLTMIRTLLVESKEQPVLS